MLPASHARLTETLPSTCNAEAQGTSMASNFKSMNKCGRYPKIKISNASPHAFPPSTTSGNDVTYINNILHVNVQDSSGIQIKAV